MAQSRGKRKQTAKVRTNKKDRPTKKVKDSADEFSIKNIEAFREVLARSVLSPLNLVLLTRSRIQEAVDDAVERGRITHADAQDLVQILVKRGRKQTNDVLSDLERLVGHGRDEIDTATGPARERATQAAVSARRKVEKTTSRVKRVGGRKVSVPISGYEKMTAAQVRKKIENLDARSLRNLKTFEQRNANRKSVLDATESRLSRVTRKR